LGSRSPFFLPQRGTENIRDEMGLYVPTDRYACGLSRSSPALTQARQRWHRP
jgi:hypothetical protein